MAEASTYIRTRTSTWNSGRSNADIDGVSMGWQYAAISSLLELVEERLRDAGVEVGDGAVRRRLQAVRSHRATWRSSWRR